MDEVLAEFEGLMNTMKNLRASRFQRQNVKLRSPEYEVEMLPTPAYKARLMLRMSFKY
jgi:hypothetical protein